MSDKTEDAWETIRFAILNELVGQMPAGSYPYLEQAAVVAVQALKDPQYSWVFAALVDGGSHV